jgi:hypothetical protein
MKEPDFAFEKKVGINEFLHGDINAYIRLIDQLFYCMQETNKIHDVMCEFFQLDFRYPNADEHFPIGSLVMHLKWGNKKELEKKELER